MSNQIYVNVYRLEPKLCFMHTHNVYICQHKISSTLYNTDTKKLRQLKGACHYTTRARPRDSCHRYIIHRKPPERADFLALYRGSLALIAPTNPVYIYIYTYSTPRAGIIQVIKSRSEKSVVAKMSQTVSRRAHVHCRRDRD